jgi:methionyl aminopeptidase
MSSIIYKTEEEIELLREANILVSRTHELIASLIRPGLTGIYLDELAESFIRDHGGRPAFKGFGGFPASLCISINEQVVHGIPSDKAFQEEDIVSVDCGVELNGFFGDSAFTYMMPNTPDKVANLCRVTEESLYKGIEKAVIGNRMMAIGHAIQSYAGKEHGYGIVRELVGHGIGRSLHEAPQVPNFGSKRRGMKIKEGLVIAIEPMINLGTREVMELKDGWTIVTKDGLPSAHYEHSIAVTKNGPDILSDHNLIKEKLKKNPNIRQLSVKI